MKAIYRFLLFLVTSLIPVVIAACYGMYYEFMTEGRVTDADTGDGIEGIRVSCVQDGAEASWVYTDTEGYYWLGYGLDEPCDSVVFTDEDGPANGGQYAAQEVPNCLDCGDLNVALSPEE